MRIIDKNNDYYDYLQDSTDTIVFDRRGSSLLTKEKFCYEIGWEHFLRNSKFRFITLQCSGTFWLILVKNIVYNNFFNVIGYDLELLAKWTNYDKPNELLKITNVNFYGDHKIYDYKTKDYVEELIKKNVSDFVDAINRNDFKVVKIVCDYKKSSPLLKACGISKVIDAQDIFVAIEEYFLIEKLRSEKTEPKGATNNDKIERHGFDLKTSFRGNQK